MTTGGASVMNFGVFTVSFTDDTTYIIFDINMTVSTGSLCKHRCCVVCSVFMALKVQQ